MYSNWSYMLRRYCVPPAAVDGKWPPAACHQLQLLVRAKLYMICQFPSVTNLSLWTSFHHSCPDHLPYGLLHCALHGAKLEDYPEATTDAEYSSISSFRHPKEGTCNTSAKHAALGASLLLALIQGVGYQIYILHGMGPGYLRKHVIPILSTHFTQSSRDSVLQTLSAKQFCCWACPVEHPPLRG